MKNSTGKFHKKITKRTLRKMSKILKKGWKGGRVKQQESAMSYERRQALKIQKKEAADKDRKTREELRKKKKEYFEKQKEKKEAAKAVKGKKTAKK